jgi:ribosomal protein S18 acetylase RimI-like enzyme
MNKSKEFRVRPLTVSDQPFLWEMLYQSLYVQEGHAPFERSILDDPNIAKYVKDWGREDDSGFVAIDENAQPVGAIWMRMLKGAEKGFGYVDDRTPEVGMAVLPEYRGRGIGTNLLSRLVESTVSIYENLSLSVASGNTAIHLYQRAGFEIVGEDGNSITMKIKLNAADNTQHNNSFNPSPR